MQAVDLHTSLAQSHRIAGRYEEAIKQIRYTKTLLGSLPPENTQDRIDRMITLSDLLTEAGMPDESLNQLYDAKHLAAKAFSPGEHPRSISKHRDRKRPV